MQPQTVKILRQASSIKVMPAFKELLAPFLTYTRRIQEGGAAKKARFVETRVYEVCGDGLITSAGLLPRVCAALRGLGITVQYEDWRKPELMAKTATPDFTKLQDLRDLQDDILIALVANEWGIIDAPTGAGKTYLIKQLIRIWPKSRFIICSPFTDVILALYHDLKSDAYHNEVGMVGAGYDETGCRVTCVIDKSLRKCDLIKADVFIFDEVHRAASPRNSEAIAQVLYARRYGFSASWEGRSDGADLETEALFGPVICKLSYQEVQATGSIVPVNVRVVSTATCPPIPKTENTTKLNRWGIWRNEKRNALLADTVKDLISELGPGTQVLITVATIEHAVHIYQHLPGFTLVYGTMDPNDRYRWERDGMLPKGVHPINLKEREQLQHDFHDGKLKWAIATGVWGTGVDFPGLNVLVRADSQSGKIPSTQLPGRVTRSDGVKDLGIVVDFDDVFNGTLAGRAERRLTEYRRKGWAI